MQNINNKRQTHVEIIKKTQVRENRMHIIRKLILNFYSNIMIHIFRIFPINTRKIISWSFDGCQGYGDSSKYIIESLHKRNDNKYIIYWILDRKHKNAALPSYVKKVIKYTPLYYYHIATSRIWIFNTRTDNYLKKRKNQYYIQTWHSALRLKMIEKDAEKSLTKDYVINAKNDSKKIDLIIAGNNQSEETFRNSFYYNGKIAMTGTPRLDPFFSKKEKQNAKKKICKKLNIESKKIILLYAPTFRKNPDSDWELDVDLLKSRLGENYEILYRAHPKTKLKEYKNCHNVTNYDDMQELLLAADTLITDYSGTCFDYLLTKQRCILYIKDLKEYIKEERNLYYKIEDLPFEQCKTLDELATILKQKVDSRTAQKQINFIEKINSIEDGKASLRVAEIIEKI